MRKHKPCRGRMNRFRQKGIEISNTFRKALGLPLIQTGPFLTGGGEVHILPVGESFIWETKPQPNGGDYKIVPLVKLPHPHHVHQSHGHLGHHAMGRQGSFTDRLNRSLMNLGRWEGRLVAFVLGCGIGVLLRMFWVLAIVTYRAIRGPREIEHQYPTVVVIDDEYEDVPVIHSPPPTYIYPVDEKVDVKEAEAPKALTTTEESK